MANIGFTLDGAGAHDQFGFSVANNNGPGYVGIYHWSSAWQQRRLHSHWFLPTISFLLLFAIVQLHHHGHSCNSSQHPTTYDRSQSRIHTQAAFIKTIQEKHLQAPLHPSRSINRTLNDDLSRLAMKKSSKSTSFWKKLCPRARDKSLSHVQYETS